MRSDSMILVTVMVAFSIANPALLGELQTLPETFDGVENSTFREVLKTRRAKMPYTQRLALR